MSRIETYEQLKEEIKRFTFKNGPLNVNFRIVVHERSWFGDASIEGRVTVIPRDGEPWHERISIKVSRPIGLPMDPRHLEDLAYSIAKQLYLHELDEAWHVDGVRVRDPHRDEPWRFKQILGT